MKPNKIAESFLHLASCGKVKEAFDRFVAANFIHHNQYFKGSREALQNAMTEAHQSSPNKSLEVKYSYEDNDTIITHSLVKKHNLEIAVVHIFRFEGLKIVELWDLGQVIEKESPNQYGLF